MTRGLVAAVLLSTLFSLGRATDISYELDISNKEASDVTTITDAIAARTGVAVSAGSAPTAPVAPSVPTTTTVLFDITASTYSHGDWLTTENTKFWQAYGWPDNDIVFPDPGETYLLSSLTVVSQPFTDTGIHFDIRTTVGGYQHVLFVYNSVSQTFERSDGLPDKTTFDPGDNLVIEHKHVALDDSNLGEYYILSLTSTTGNTVHIKVKPDGSYAT